MGDAPLHDVLDGVLRDPFHRVLMGVTAENVAARFYAISREAQDEAACESHRRAAHALKEGYFEIRSSASK